MQAKPLSMIIIAVAAVLVAGFSPAALEAQGELSKGPQLLIKIRDIDQFLNAIERLMPAGEGAAPPPQAAMLRGMLQGTDWIDPERAIVAGMTVDGDISRWIALIPFRTANANFQTAYGAIAGDDYYLMALPPQPGFGVAPEVKASLISASTQPAVSGLMVEAAASELAATAQPKIAAAIARQAANPARPSGPAAMSPAETQAMLTDMLKMFEQMQTVRLGLDLTGDVLTLQFDVDARPESFLAGLLIDRGDAVRLADYDVARPLQFRSRAYNVPGMMQLVATGFGQIYSQMGLDLDEMADMTKSFTGEMAGGMTADADGMAYEMVYVLQPGVDGEAFILDTYLPWFERYNRQMATFVAQQANQPQLPPLYERTADSIVDGVKVVGVKTNYNAMLPPGDQNLAALAGGGQIFETRLAAVDDLVLIGHDDAVMAELITRARGFETAPAQGPMARFDFDLAAFMEGLEGMLPPGDLPSTWPSDLGRLTMQAEMQAGKLTTRTRFNIADLGKMGTVFGTLAARQAAVAGGADAGAPDRETASPPADKRATDTPDDCYRRGGLQSAYGAYDAAAKSYRKAIALAPRFADAHFQLGVAYGEMRQFEAAVMAMTQAIDLDDDQGAYYYGRGRVYLLAGQEEAAMRDFMEAGFRGHPDARAYLNAAGVSLE